MATVVLPQHVLNQLVPLGAGCVGVYVAAAAEADREGFAEVSQVVLSDRLNLDREMLRSCIRRLAYAGLVEVVQNPGRPMVMRFPFGKAQSKAPSGNTATLPDGNTATHLAEIPPPTRRKYRQVPSGNTATLRPEEGDLAEIPPPPSGNTANPAEEPSRTCVVSLSNSTELVVDNGDLKGTEENLESCREIAKIDDLTDSPIPPVSEPVAKTKRGTRLPADWQAPKDVCRDIRQWCQDRGIAVTNQQILDWADMFRDYWSSVPGAKGTKLDWAATWRNWAKREAGDLARKQRGWQTPTSTPDEGPDADRARKRNEQAAVLRQERRELVERFEQMGAAEQVAQYEALTDGQKMAVREVLKDEAWKQITSGLKQALRAGLAGSVGGAA